MICRYLKSKITPWRKSFLYALLLLNFSYSIAKLKPNTMSEAVAQSCSVKNVFLQISQKFRLRPATLLKKRLWHRCFLVSFAKFLRTPFFTKHLRWLLRKRGYSIYNFRIKVRLFVTLYGFCWIFWKNIPKFSSSVSSPSLSSFEKPYFIKQFLIVSVVTRVAFTFTKTLCLTLLSKKVYNVYTKRKMKNVSLQ